MTDQDIAYDVAFQTVVADMISVKVELEQENYEEAKSIIETSLEKHEDSAAEI